MNIIYRETETEVIFFAEPPSDILKVLRFNKDDFIKTSKSTYAKILKKEFKTDDLKLTPEAKTPNLFEIFYDEFETH